MDEAHAGPGTGGRRPAGSGIPVGRIFGVPVSLTVPWFLLSALITVGYGELVSRRLPGLPVAVAYLIGLALVSLLLISVLVHELGHALLARRHGVPVRRVTLDLLGGHTELEHDLPRPGVEAMVALVGPAISLLFGLAWLAAWAALPDGWLGADVIFQVALVNLVVAGYNALPGLPLDGGRALGAAVWAVSGRRELGDEVAGWAGRVVAVGTAAVGALGYSSDRLGGPGLAVFWLVALSLWSGAGASIQHARTARRIPLLTAGALARPLLTVPAGTPLSQLPRRPAGTELGVVDSGGRLTGLVEPVALRRIPLRQWPWTAVTEVSTAVPLTDWLPAPLAGKQLLARISRPDGRVDPSRVFPVVFGEDGVGVLRVTDVIRAMNGGPVRLRPGPATVPAQQVPPGPPAPESTTPRPPAA